jgi:D-xylose ABC transporter substrate-binding protein
MRKILVFILTTTMFLSFTLGQTENKPPKIGLLMANFINVRWYKDKEFFESKVREMGAIPLTRDASNNPNNQLLQAQELIDSGVQVLVIIPVDAKSAGAIVSVAHNSQVPVIAYDRLIMNCDLDYYISFNSIQVGQFMAEYVTKMKPEGTYVFLNGPESDHNSVLINEGVMKVLKPYIDEGKIDLAYSKYLSEWIELDAYLTLEEYFEYTRDVDVIITGGDILARGVLMSLDEWGISGEVLLTGQNGDLQAIQDILTERQTMTIYKSLRIIGETSAEVAVKLAQGKKVEWPEKVYNGKKQISSILFEPVIVDKKNIKETVIKDGHLTEEQVYGK